MYVYRCTYVHIGVMYTYVHIHMCIYRCTYIQTCEDVIPLAFVWQLLDVVSFQLSCIICVIVSTSIITRGTLTALWLFVGCFLLSSMGLLYNWCDYRRGMRTFAMQFLGFRKYNIISNWLLVCVREPLQCSRSHCESKCQWIVFIWVTVPTNRKTSSKQNYKHKKLKSPFILGSFLQPGPGVLTIAIQYLRTQYRR